MEERLENDVEFSEEMFNKIFKTLSKKGGGKYEEILKGGSSFHAALLKLFEVVWNGEQMPESWRNTVIIPMFKGTGSKSDMNS